MIRHVDDPSASILDDPSDVLVCPVCTVPGVMGAGLARDFREKWPGLVDVHRAAVVCGHLRPGFPWFVELYDGVSDWATRPGTPCICLFPTKDHWRDPSRLAWIAAGLDHMAGFLRARRPPLRTLALPALGCGLGGLAWADVRPLIEACAAGLPGRTFTVYAPREATRR